MLCFNQNFKKAEKRKGSIAVAQTSAQETFYTIDDIYHLPEGTRAELIDGQIYYMAPPSRRHQDILSFLHLAIGNHLAKKHGGCRVYPAPFAVFPFAGESRYFEPDISVICDENKLNERGCNGAPDWIIEIVSPGSKAMDYYTKLFLYRQAGVREYWIVDPLRESILVYDMQQAAAPAVYTFTNTIRSCVYDDLEIDFSEMRL